LLTGILAKNFGYVSLQSWKEEVVKAALKGTNTIVIQPTGNGKSLRYQFLLFVTGGTAIVISPITVSILILIAGGNVNGEQGLEVSNVSNVQKSKAKSNETRQKQRAIYETRKS